ncbi:hypothetical protein [Candidatus Sulfurimonas baltica]|uniref:Uncharacterized protein n=1 Tax=Candidatus Sulfurimonas baltica TaxID=2740404 RepID=A0A7S7LUG1_9BACT|nr:hypothetical protein [Candidatus Sulfurimonas baltica]QOY50914.1 hypothetical protein HUE88_07095 [Candidatus Sulfurimonas baltica]
MNHKTTTLEWLEDTFKGARYVSKPQAGKVLSVSTASINNYMTQHQNRLESVKLNPQSKQSAVRISLDSLATFIDNLSNTKDIQDE